ncbi:MAG: methylenetetrahydrofolate reductase [NAD(P)H] [Candidatus Lambdaproteobacteria bacterium]|nr:methylenetetrahydrofolate reductase [NAD(P)H] [Candidatus Lambdaproteobacteria bacterium]
MRIRNLYLPSRPVFSIELFPPKTPEGLAALKAKLSEVRDHKPDFMSVTYGAGGSTQRYTLEICATLLQEFGIEAMAHLTCVAHTRGEIRTLLGDLKQRGVSNIMALRGDPPRCAQGFTPHPDGFRYAIELVRAIVEVGDFGIGVAGYPEGHAEAPDYASDLQHLVEKVRAGADFVVSQFFLDNARFLRWRDDLARAGVTVPVSAGILPAVSVKQITGFAATCKVEVPRRLLEGLERYANDPDSVTAYGVEYAQRQVLGLLAEGVSGIHLYALNRVQAMRRIAPIVRAVQTTSHPLG